MQKILTSLLLLGNLHADIIFVGLGAGNLSTTFDLTSSSTTTSTDTQGDILSFYVGMLDYDAMSTFTYSSVSAKNSAVTAYTIALSYDYLFDFSGDLRFLAGLSVGQFSYETTSLSLSTIYTTLNLGFLYELEDFNINLSYGVPLLSSAIADTSGSYSYEVTNISPWIVGISYNF